MNQTHLSTIHGAILFAAIGAYIAAPGPAGIQADPIYDILTDCIDDASIRDKEAYRDAAINALGEWLTTIGDYDYLPRLPANHAKQLDGAINRACTRFAKYQPAAV